MSNAKPWEHAKSGEGSGGDPLAARFVASLDYDKRLYKHDIRGSIAHARMLCKVGLITDADLKEIERGLKEIEKEIDEHGDAWPGWKIELEDVHMCIEAALIEKTGDAGRKLHTGRSRNDQVALDLVLWVENERDNLAEKCSNVSAAFVELAGKYGKIVMPSYTHLQRAQPILVGAELLTWADAIRHRMDCFHVLTVNNRETMLGAGAIAGSSLSLDRFHIREALELNYLVPPSIRATASRDSAVDFVYSISMVSMWLSRWAEQWIIYATTEFGFITLDNLYTTGSSMMPQKQNPDMLELIRGKTGLVYGSLMALLTMCKGLTIGYNRDLQEDKRHVFAAYDAVCDCLDMAARIVRTTKFNEERIKQGLDRGFLDATSLAEYLVTQGVPFRTAHQVVGALVRKCQNEGIVKLSELQLGDFNSACAAAGQKEVCDKDIFDWLGPENVVKRYQTAGNAGVSGFEQQLKAWKERLSQND